MTTVIKLNSQEINSQADVFRALSSPARLVVLSTLLDGERSVNDLVEVLAYQNCACSAERTNLSKHLATLRQIGLVNFNGDAQRRLYFLTNPELVRALISSPFWKQFFASDDSNTPLNPHLPCCK
jgi:DNA-binding transcriptional ArsR family regulator